MKTFQGAPTISLVAAIVFMLHCLGPSYCIESSAFSAVNPIWLRWLREQRSNPLASAASAPAVSILGFPEDDGKVVAFKERGERTIQPRKLNGFAIFNDFNQQPAAAAVAAATVVSSTTLRPEATTLHLPSSAQPQLTVTFANLLERARKRTAEDTPNTTPMISDEGATFPPITTTISTTTTTTSTTPSTTTSTTTTSTTTRSSTTTTKTSTTTTVSTTTKPVLTSFKDLRSLRSSSRYKPRAVTSQRPVSLQRLIKSTRVPLSRLVINKRRQNIRERKPVKTSSPTRLITSIPTTTTTTTTATTTVPTTTTTSEIYTNVKTASAMIVTRTVTSTEEVPFTTAAATTTASTTTTTPVTTTTTPVTTTTTPVTTTTSDYNTYPPPRAEFLQQSRDWPRERSTTTTTAPLTTTTYEPEITTTFDIDEAATVTVPLASEIYSGQYHEVNPGQYHEVNPGQYHETNPGQYHEINPGQYYENNPGQYIGDDLGQGITEKSLNDVKVEVQHTDDAQIYNVQSKVDRFIIGEYGTISKESGQTLQGVRYTAVDDVAVDPRLIYATLIKYFPMQAGLDPGDYET